MEPTSGPLASLSGAGNATAMGWKPRWPKSALSLFIVVARLRHFADLKNKNSIITTLPLKLESRTSLPEGSWMVNSGDLRGIEADGTAAVVVIISHTRASDVSFRMGLEQRRGRRIVAVILLVMGQPTCFHLSTMRCISAAPAAAAFSALCSPLRTFATILGTTMLLKISMNAGLAIPGTPRLGVQCRAS